jgi:hypothetical protein
MRASARRKEGVQIKDKEEEKEGSGKQKRVQIKDN